MTDQFEAANTHNTVWTKIRAVHKIKSVANAHVLSQTVHARKFDENHFFFRIIVPNSQLSAKDDISNKQLVTKLINDLLGPFYYFAKSTSQKNNFE